MIEKNMYNRVKFILLVNVIILVAIVAGCKKSNNPKVTVKKAISSAASTVPKQQSAVKSITPNTSVVTTSTYYYNPAGKPDPFEPFDIAKIKSTTAITPLQQFSLDQLTLKGIIWGTSNAKAIMQDPTGKTYIVGTGAKIGKNNGVIIRILNDKVVVLEKYTDVFTGKIKTNKVTMELKKTEKF